MSRREKYQFEGPKAGAPVYWTSIDELENPASVTDAQREREFPEGAAELTDPFSRRSFLGLMSASIALAGLEGCARRPVQHIVPYRTQPEDLIPGVPSHYATVINRRGEALGVVVESHEGRPTKVEGNPEHASSMGRADMLAQAAVLDVYDPDRTTRPHEGNTPRNGSELQAALERRLAAAGRGERLRFLVQPTNSPTFVRMRQAVMARYPGARFHTWSAVNESNIREGARLAFGQVVTPVPDFARARVILALDADFLQTEAGNVRATLGYSAGRRVRSPSDTPNRLYVVEPTFTVTGGNADHRLRLAARDIEGYVIALANELATRHEIDLREVTGALAGRRTTVPAEWISAVAADLADNRGTSLLVAGSRQPPTVHALVHAINAALGNAGTTVSYYPPADAAETDQVADLRNLADAMGAGEVSTLIMMGVNPAYDAPGDIPFVDRLARVEFSLLLSDKRDETGQHCTWFAPRAHEFEAWGDQQSFDGTVTIQQPLIEPLFNGNSDIEMLALIAQQPSHVGLDLVRETVAGGPVAGMTAAATREWRRALHRGVARPAGAAANVTPRGAEIATQLRARTAPTPLGRDNLEVVFLADHKMLDGRHGNNVWLLELPDPITRITWDNAAYVSQSTAHELGLHSGDMVRLSRQGARPVEIVVWVLPGQPDHSIALPLGWGRTHTGRQGNGKGFNVSPLRMSSALHFMDGVRLEKLGREYRLAQTQEHDRMENRPIALEATVEEFRANPHFSEERSPTPRTLPLWREVDYGLRPGEPIGARHKWGMVVDLNACTGCNACAVACQSENNVPNVGKDQVYRGREMYWLRVDRYFTGTVEDPLAAFQPLACVHCEEAPCENVCPVNATSHSPEGLNDMTYNRCIGTRYCANNCPYKVRRFNYLNWHNDGIWDLNNIPETLRMAHNPNVSVRSRGVMEKCSYCVQRIQTVKIGAHRTGRQYVETHEPGAEPALQSACQQTCPANAIVLGDLNDPQSRVSQADRSPNRYKLLGEIGTQPRTTYLARIRNPNPAMPSQHRSTTESHG